MYYILYLSSLCRRRRWTDPHYICTRGDYGKGFTCTVRVNHREYKTDAIAETEELAKEAAAMNAYLICRNLSVSEGQANNNNNVIQQQPGVQMANTGGGWHARRGS
ncbi:hypothetical protein EDC01DRAFT_401498 [Geopyxis carbonaria]|nr:hypothetical protein EDC01DRAFT_401498 [Geopyxis carbonaria]